MQRFSEGDRARVDIADETDPDYERYHGFVGRLSQSSKTTPVGLPVASVIRFSFVWNSKTVVSKTSAGATFVHRNRSSNQRKVFTYPG